MKVLSIRQPWATLIALGEKKFETRSWQTKYRGELAIHSSKVIDREACKMYPIAEVLNKHGIVLFDDLPTGKIIATSRLIDCYQVNMEELCWASFGNGGMVKGNEFLFGDYSIGRFAWELQNVKLLDEPIPAKGQLNLWEHPIKEEIGLCNNTK